MRTMLKVGEFARLGGVSRRLLRHYDALGLLSPSYTDPVTGYRYYQAWQLYPLRRILALKDLGLSLEQITHLTQAAVEPLELRGMLRLKAVELEEEAALLQARLARVRATLAQLEQWEHLLDDQEITLQSLPAMQTLQIATILEPGEWVGNFFQQMRPYVAATRLCLGTAFTIYTRSYDPLAQRMMQEQQRLMLRIGYCSAATLETPLKLSPRHELVSVEIPAYARSAVLVYRGSDQARGPVIQAMRRWVEGQGYQLAAPIREFYLHRERDPASENHITEVQMPLQ